MGKRVGFGKGLLSFGAGAASGYLSEMQRQERQKKQEERDKKLFELLGQRMNGTPSSMQPADKSPQADSYSPYEDAGMTSASDVQQKFNNGWNGIKPDESNQDALAALNSEGIFGNENKVDYDEYHIDP